MIMLTPDMQFIDDEEGQKVPDRISRVIDSHVHVFPDDIFSAVWKWFDAHAWPIRYQKKTSDIFEFLLSHGVDHIIALQYAHKPGMAGFLNTYMAEECTKFKGRVMGMATVLPGEDHAQQILQDAFDNGLGGVKLHVHVQCFDMNDASMVPVYECCQENGKPLVIHAGREPKSPAYACDPYQLCSAGKLEQVITDFPELKVCVPHLGFNEIHAYRDLVEKYDTLWLDTAMAICDYFSIKERTDLSGYRPDRIMYGSDFPNIPYAWDRELKILNTLDLSPDALDQITYRNAVDFFNLKL